MTTNGSPVYLMYPPDRSGRRPNEYTQLQYANPAQREARREFEASTFNTDPNYAQNEYSYYAGPAATNRAALQRTSTTHATTERLQFIRGGGDYTSSEGSNGPVSRPRTQPTRTTYWYCCNEGCPMRGPYIEAVYDNCALGCGRVRCSGCPREIVSLRDRPPSDIPSSWSAHRR